MLINCQPRITHKNLSVYFQIIASVQGRIQDFKLRGWGAQLKKLCRAEIGVNFFVGISCEKSRFYAKKSYFFQF